jgi:hypothetical protein
VYVVVPDEAPFADTRCADEVLTPSSMIPSEHFSVFDLRCTCQAGLAQEAARSE